MMTPKLEEPQAKMQLFLYLLESRSKSLEIDFQKEILNRLDEEDVARSYNLVDSFFSFNTLTRNLIPTIEINGEQYVGREDDFDNLTCGEFEDADIYFNQFTQSRQVDALLNLVAILYRKGNSPYMTINNLTGKLETADVSGTVKLLEQTEAWQLYACYIWFFGCKSQLPDYFPTVFAGGEEGKQRDPHAFTKCIHAGAGPKNGTRDQIRVTLMKEFFMDMELEAIQAEELKNNYGKH